MYEVKKDEITEDDVARIEVKPNKLWAIEDFVQMAKRSK